MPTVTILRTPEWASASTLPPGTVIALPASIADPLLAAGQAVHTPGAATTHDDPFGAGGSGVNTTLAAAGIAAAAAGGTLTPLTLYAASDSGALYYAYSSSIVSAITTSAHLGTITTAAMLAVSSPSEGMTCDVSDLDVVSSLPVRCIYNGARWRLRNALRMRKRGDGAASTGAQYPTNTRFALPAGALALCSSFDLMLKLALNDTPDTDTVTSWRLKLGTLGTASDATIASVTSALAAGENQRAYHLSGAIESATSIRMDQSSGVSTQAWAGNAQTTLAAAAASLGGSDTTASALYLGLDYTMGAATNPCTTTAILTLYP